MLWFTSQGSPGAYKLGSRVSGDGPKPSEDGATTALPAFAHTVLLDRGAFAPHRAQHWDTKPAWVTAAYGFLLAELSRCFRKRLCTKPSLNQHSPGFNSESLSVSRSWGDPTSLRHRVQSHPCSSLSLGRWFYPSGVK